MFRDARTHARMNRTKTVASSGRITLGGGIKINVQVQLTTPIAIIYSILSVN